MIRIEHTTPDAHTYLLRPIQSKDVFALADILRDRADDGSGKYRISNAFRDCDIWQDQNASMSPAPWPDPQTYTWVLEYYGETIGFIRIGYWFRHSHVVYMAVHPAYRGQGHFKIMTFMVMQTIVPLGAQDLSFESLASAPAVVVFAENYLKLAPEETRVGDTQQVVTKYTFTKDHFDTVAADVTVPVVITSTIIQEDILDVSPV